MSEADAIAASDGPATVRSLAADLGRLGVRTGDVLLVHSSLRSIGWVAGREHAVVLALLEAVGPSGTVVVPAHTGDWSDPAGWENPPVPQAWWATIRAHMPAFDPAVTRSRGMGRIAECARTWPGAVRSDHPLDSCAAVGSRAAEVCAVHTLANGVGDDSPVGTLYAIGARTLLLGVGYGNATCIHLAEYRTSWPGKRIARTGASTRDGWVSFDDVDGCSDDFEVLGADYERSGGTVCTGTVGRATARLVPIPELVDFAAGWIARNRR